MIGIEDWAQINDLLARYCWNVDEADGDGWASLFTEDGEMNGMGLNLKGREQLKGMALGMKGGGMRHLYSNLVAEYSGGGKDEVQAKYYSYVANYAPQGVNVVGMALCRATIVRQGGEWKIRRNNIDLVGPTPGA